MEVNVEAGVCTGSEVEVGPGCEVDEDWEGCDEGATIWLGNEEVVVDVGDGGEAETGSGVAEVVVEAGDK